MMGAGEARDRRVPPDIPALLRCFVESGVEFVLAGFVAVEAWGADVGTPGDLDIVPGLGRENLTRLARYYPTQRRRTAHAGGSGA